MAKKVGAIGDSRSQKKKKKWTRYQVPSTFDDTRQLPVECTGKKKRSDHGALKEQLCRSARDTSL